MKTIGITTTVPIEILKAAGYQAIDLNNILVSDADPGRLVSIAERHGFPLNCCSWIKGIYGACFEYDINSIVCVTSGDCSNSIMLMEVLKLKGLNAIPFAYPEHPDTAQMQRVLESFAARLGTTLEAAGQVRGELQPVRTLAHKMDKLTWKDNIISGFENHFWQVSASDFNHNVSLYEKDLKNLLQESSQRQPYADDSLRLAYIGVPPVFGKDLYRHLEYHGANVVFNEIQRQFTMPDAGGSLAEQYTRYTYPYSVHERIRDIKKEIKRRNVDAVIHYVQAFCHRAIGDIIFRDAFDLPILTLEGNNDFHLTNHVKTRIEAFLDMLERRQKGFKPSRKALA
jgi:benzoyl-CoA reductase/2-hydroxyglutaryl-CoA dehydratase subunit BcrC/BadD/HgdB